MKQKNIYSINLFDTNSYWPNYRILKNNKVVYPCDLTPEEIKIIVDELDDYHSFFMERLNNLTD